jgi:hypothetical protein
VAAYLDAADKDEKDAPTQDKGVVVAVRLTITAAEVDC